MESFFADNSRFQFILWEVACLYPCSTTSVVRFRVQIEPLATSAAFKLIKRIVIRPWPSLVKHLLRRLQKRLARNLTDGPIGNIITRHGECFAEFSRRTNLVFQAEIGAFWACHIGDS